MKRSHIVIVNKDLVRKTYVLSNAKLQNPQVNCENHTLNTSFANFPSIVLYNLHDSFTSQFLSVFLGSKTNKPIIKLALLICVTYYLYLPIHEHKIHNW